MNSHSFCRMHCSAILFVAAAALPFCSGCESNPSAQVVPAAGTPAGSATAAPAPVPDPPLGISDPRSFTTTGPLVAEQQADIAAERDGRVASIAVQIGDRVRIGQVMAQLDDRELRATREQQKARLASAQAQVSVWEAEKKADGADLRRADLMRTEKIISEENWEHVKYKQDEAIAELSHARSEEAAAQAALGVATVQLEQSRIVAPFNGVVGRSSVRMAQQVKAGDVLFWITAEAPLRVLFTVPETAMAAFTIGRPLELTTADYPGLRQEGRILRVSPVVDPASGSVQVIGAMVRPSPLLKPGMSMQVRLAP